MWHLIDETPGWMAGAMDFVARNPEAALLVAFLAAIVEALAIVGMFVPGTFIVMGVAGAAAASGQRMFPFLAVAVLGAVIGDFLSYWIGYRYRSSVRQSWPLKEWSGLMERTDRFFARYGSFSVALCRFIPVLRSTIPLVAGITGMSRTRFLIANVSSALIWAPTHIWPAQLAGLSLERLRAGDWSSAALIAAGVLTFGIVIWLVHRRLTPFLARR